VDAAADHAQFAALIDIVGSQLLANLLDEADREVNGVHSGVVLGDVRKDDRATVNVTFDRVSFRTAIEPIPRAVSRTVASEIIASSDEPHRR
jgi:hypothetical protein